MSESKPELSSTEDHLRIAHPDHPIGGIAAFDEGFKPSGHKVNNPTTIIEDTTLAIDSLIQQQVPLLDLRAKAYGQLGKFTEAIKDARLIIQYTPTASVGYQRLGSLYIMQGRAVKAVEAYDRGIAAVSSKYAQALQEAKHVAELQMSKRIDFVLKVPYDILYNIFNRISTQERVICTRVSKAWRDRIIHDPELWDVVQLDATSQGWDLLPSVCSHIQSMCLRDLKDGQVGAVFNQTTMASSFRQVQSFELSRCAIESRLVLIAFWQMLSLTELTLDLKRPVITVGEILVACPNLTCLSYKYQSDHPWPKLSTDIRLPNILKLESLAIYNEQVDQGDIQVVLRKCPEMQNLYIRRSNFGLLEVINTCCPHLKVLAVNSSHASKLPPSLFKRASEKMDGLQALVIDPYNHTDLQQRQVIPLLTKSMDTLKSLAITLHPQQPTTSLLQLGSFGGSRLTTINLTGFRRGFQAVVASILRQCPALVSVGIDQSDILSDSVIFDGLGTLNSLRNIELFESTTQVHRAGLRRFFGKHAELGAKSSLRVVKLFQLSGVDDSILSEIAMVTSLETITLQQCNDITADGLEQFIKDLVSSKLTMIGLAQLRGLTDRTVERLGDILSLKQIRLWYSDDVTDDGIGNLAEKAVSLKTMAIYQCPNVTNFMRKYLTDFYNIRLEPM